MMNKIILAIATGLGTGYSPVASGTAGSLLGLLIAFLFAHLGGHSSFNGIGYPAMTVLIFAVGTWTAGRAEVLYNQKDSGKIVIDEIAGMLVTLYLLPATMLYCTLGFFLFRFFDVVKPAPARRIDTYMKGGLGVMLDDVVAAVYANLCLQVLRKVIS